MDSRPASGATVKAGESKGRKFDLDDACCLKSDPSLVGHVSRTYYDVDTHGPLDHLLVLSYSAVPQQELVDFLKTGAPPKGYVFISFAEPSQGNSLIHEDDLDLVNRSLPLGQIVKRDLKDTISGTVISTSRKCNLEPIAYRTLDSATGECGPLQFTEKSPGQSGDTYKTGDSKSRMLYDIPLSEVQYYETFSEGDYIVYRQKVGIIQQIDRDVVLLLPNQAAVSPLDPSALEIPLAIGSNPIVSFPSDPDAIRSKSLSNGESVWTTEAEPLYPGQYAFTSRNNLRSGDWISGTYSELQTPEGHIIATPAMDIHVDWLCPNIFAVGLPYHGPNSEVIRASTLQGQASKCDFGKLPTNGYNKQTVQSDVWLSIGDRVRFRNPANAAAKYPQYQPISTDQSLGYDLNVFRIVSSKTEVTVQWQDLSVTTEEATALHKSTEAADEVWPGDLVVLRDGVEVINKPGDDDYDWPTDKSRTHQCETLGAKKVGVVQSVDSRERIASVRWYKDPSVQLLHRGNMLKPSSTLGELSDTVTDVSVYELNSYPSLGKSLDDLVLLAPENIHQSMIAPEATHIPSKGLGPCLLSFLYPITFFELEMFLQSIKQAVVASDQFKNTTKIESTPLPSRFSVHRDEHSDKSPAGFVGRIIATGLDGTITVRLAESQNCRDICVPMEKILMVIDDDNAVPYPPFPPFPPFGIMGFDDAGAFIPSELSISRTVEYEGGERLDDDSGDDQWETEDEPDESEDEEEDMEDIEEIEDDVNDGDSLVAPEVAEISLPQISDLDKEEVSISQHEIHPHIEATKSSTSSLSLADCCPASFYVLESLPPADHQFLSTTMPEVSGLRLKRIRKEYDILGSSLPPGIFVRTWESRMDLMRVLIIGPQGTPYEYAPFVIDFQFSDDYPNSPPASFFHSWTNGLGMVNPNLYEDGKICLSILGTWPTKNPDERWSPIKSTILQILVSLMGLVLVKTPFYNEAGYEAFAAEDNNRVESAQYTEKAFLMTRNFIKHAIQNPVPGFEDVLAWNYLPDSTPGDEKSARPRLLQRAIDEALAMIDHHNKTSSGQELNEDSVVSPFVSRLSLGAVVMLRKHVAALEKVAAEVNPKPAPEEVVL